MLSFRMTGYTKLFGSILASTIWGEKKETKILWITMLALANKYGEVAASVPGLATLARLTLDETKAAILSLTSPDEYSRTKDFEGRRIEAIDGGWKILNHGKYRDIMGKEERREYLKIKQQEHRFKVKTAVNTLSTPSTNVNFGQSASTLSTHAAPAPAPAPEEEDILSPSLRVLKHLNASAGKKFRPIKSHLRFIEGRINSVKGDIEGIFRMIDRQVTLWRGSNMEEYLRPSTLFNATKFNEYYDLRDIPAQAVGVAKTPFNLTTIIKAKQESADKIKFKNFSGDRWTNKEAYEAYIAIRKEIRVLEDQLAQLA